MAEWKLKNIVGKNFPDWDPELEMSLLHYEVFKL